MNNCSGVLENCTIVDNTAGAGLRYCDGVVRNCIVWGNNGPDFLEGSVPTYSCYAGGTGMNIDVDPCFVDAEGGDYHLRLGSGCIDAGDPCGATSEVDIDGFARVVDGDGDVDTRDWSAFGDAIGSAWPDAKYDARGDLDRDGDVDMADWPLFRDHFARQIPADCGYDGAWPPVD